jgi:photosystem II stability/assembly factor-like uncharacterized protein
MYLTARDGGLLKSEDGGTSWRPASHGRTDAAVRDVAVSPASPDIVVATGPTTGELLLTTDGGVSWSAQGLGFVSALAFLPERSSPRRGRARPRLLLR